MTSTLAKRLVAGVDYVSRPFLDLFRSDEDELVIVKFFPYVDEKTDEPSAYGVIGPHALFVVPGIEDVCSLDGQFGYDIESPASVDELAKMYMAAIHQSVRGGMKAEIAQLDNDVLRGIVSINHSMLDQPEIAVVRYNFQFPGNGDRDARDVFDLSMASALDNFTSAVDKLGTSCSVLPIEA